MQLTIQEVASKPGPAVRWNYDIMDPWVHHVSVTKIEDASTDLQTKLTDGARAGIPEVNSCLCQPRDLTQKKLLLLYFLQAETSLGSIYSGRGHRYLLPVDCRFDMFLADQLHCDQCKAKSRGLV